MPELPEVETVVRALRKTILGKKIHNASATAHQLFENRGLLQNIGKTLKGDLFNSIDRHGKYLLFHLRSGRAMVAHMKMTGHFLVAHDKEQITNNKHIRFMIGFAEGTKLLFSDVRKFGRIWLLSPGNVGGFLKDRRLGHDALSKDATEAYLHTALLRHRAIKSLLLDQSVIAGVGNIYADEALWDAQIHPLRKGSSLTEADIRALWAAIRAILKKGIKAGGTSIRDSKKPDGSPGYFQMERAVYQKAGESCPRCKTKIKRIVVGQRGTHFCPTCQKE